MKVWVEVLSNRVTVYAVADLPDGEPFVREFRGETRLQSAFEWIESRGCEIVDPPEPPLAVPGVAPLLHFHIRGRDDAECGSEGGLWTAQRERVTCSDCSNGSKRGRPILSLAEGEPAPTVDVPAVAAALRTAVTSLAEVCAALTATLPAGQEPAGGQDTPAKPIPFGSRWRRREEWR